MKKTQKNNGITLIALVITIIVLLILAAISIATLTGKNGILTKANLAKTRTEEETLKEEIKLAYNSVQSSALLNDWDSDKKAETLQKELAYADKNVTVEVENTSFKISYKNTSFLLDSNGEITILGNLKLAINEFSIAGTKVTNITPPSGFVHVGGTIEEGYVISDSASDKDAGVDANLTGNQFVWVPVDKDQKITVDVTSQENITSLVVTDPYGDDILTENNVGKKYSNTNLAPTINGPYRLTVTIESGEVKKNFLNVHSLYAIDTLKDLEDMEETDFMDGSEMKKYQETEDYKDKVNRNGGFYIGRYEAGDSSAIANRNMSTQDSGTLVTKKDQFVFNWISQTNALSKAKAYNSTLTSSLPTGAAWDRIIGWLYETQEKSASSLINIDPSWGHYYFDDFSNSPEAPIKTGTFNQTRVKNIYDLQGNVSEWTTEITSLEGPFPVANNARGGTWSMGGEISFRFEDADAPIAYHGFRIALYLN